MADTPAIIVDNTTSTQTAIANDSSDDEDADEDSGVADVQVVDKLPLTNKAKQYVASSCANPIISLPQFPSLHHRRRVIDLISYKDATASTYSPCKIPLGLSVKDNKHLFENTTKLKMVVLTIGFVTYKYFKSDARSVSITLKPLRKKDLDLMNDLSLRYTVDANGEFRRRRCRVLPADCHYFLPRLS